ncbi:hypothetical protein [Endozoicomonas numazuensis]|uniref:Uncharacterized protein n=1 Tax=Endozoicomonas numazuensis TaxID=1137799 RepID=A0A081NEE2_9GAMM|nr:hypothetical protein [Endozoicomonas numazuensis]KEQ16815.1 hypothetical protein GZ78_19275 [Endozoicomonas numazuensis]
MVVSGSSSFVIRKYSRILPFAALLLLSPVAQSCFDSGDQRCYSSRGRSSYELIDQESSPCVEWWGWNKPFYDCPIYVVLPFATFMILGMVTFVIVELVEFETLRDNGSHTNQTASDYSILTDLQVDDEFIDEAKTCTNSMTPLAQLEPEYLPESTPADVYLTSELSTYSESEKPAIAYGDLKFLNRMLCNKKMDNLCTKDLIRSVQGMEPEKASELVGKIKVLAGLVPATRAISPLELPEFMVKLLGLKPETSAEKFYLNHEGLICPSNE